MPTTGKAWAVGYYVSGRFVQQTLIEHFDGTVWSVVPSPSPGALQNILFGVGAITDSDVWAVGGEQDANGLWHTLTEHWDGPAWSVVSAVDAGSSGNQLYAVKALATDDVYAVGQQAGAGVPNQALIEHWNGKSWSVVSSPADASASVLPLGGMSVSCSPPRVRLADVAVPPAGSGAGGASAGRVDSAPHLPVPSSPMAALGAGGAPQ